jgi:hypothetical protein
MMRLHRSSKSFRYSFGSRNDDGFPDDLRFDVLAQAGFSHEVNPGPEQFLQVPPQPEEGEQGRGIRKLDEEIDVLCFGRLAPNHRAEQAQRLDIELRTQLLPVLRQGLHHYILALVHGGAPDPV